MASLTLSMAASAALSNSAVLASSPRFRRPATSRSRERVSVAIPIRLPMFKSMPYSPAGTSSITRSSTSRNSRKPLHGFLQAVPLLLDVGLRLFLPDRRDPAEASSLGHGQGHAGEVDFADPLGQRRVGQVTGQFHLPGP